MEYTVAGEVAISPGAVLLADAFVNPAIRNAGSSAPCMLTTGIWVCGL